MDRDKAIELLKSGPNGVREWNEYRKSGKTIPDLSGANLYGANLIGAKLSGTTLRLADLSGATLRLADLSIANLSEADLSGAGLSRANLSDADLSGADLSEADLSSAQLSEANLLKSHCARTVFGNVDLSTVKGLEEVVHLGPSTVGVDTLIKSKGEIPEVFLRGCGVPNEIIAYIPSLIGSLSPFDFYSCFISYSHADKTFARRLHDSLQGRGIRCWLDEHQILPGDNIYKEVDLGVRLWDKVLLCASEASLKSWWVEREVDTAFEKEMTLKKERGTETLAIIPLNLDGHLFDWDGSHAAALRKRLAPDFTDWEKDNAKFEAQFEKIVKALQTKREPPPKPKL